MNNQKLSKAGLTVNPDFLFIIFLFLHIAAWTLGPWLIRANLPLDAVEGATWGHQLEWGYDKNPPLNAWLTALATYLDHYSGWMIYLFSQLSVAAAMVSVYALGKKIAPAVYALVAVLLLEGMQYFNFHAIDFNDNTLELGLWAVAIYSFYLAIQKRNLVAWITTGLLLGLGMMAKYYTLALVAALGLYLLRKPYRTQLFSAAPYLGLLAFLLIQLPHWLWLPQNHYVTITYMFDRTNAIPHWYNHLFFPAQFMWQQIEVILPSLIFFGLLFIGGKPRTVVLATKKEDKLFLMYASLGPFLLTALLSFVLGIKLRAGWGMPLLTFWTLLIILCVTPRLSRIKVMSLFYGILIFTCALLTGYAVSILDSKDTSSANFPGKLIAETLTIKWHNTYHQQLAYVAGPRWVNGNIAFYSKDHPTVFMEWDTTRTTWIKLEDMKKHGAIFVWEISDGESLPEEVAKQYPDLEKTMVMEFDWQRNQHQLPPVKLGVAFLPPQNSGV